MVSVAVVGLVTAIAAVSPAGNEDVKCVPVVRVVPLGTANVAPFRVMVDVGADVTVPSNDTAPLLFKFSVKVLLLRVNLGGVLATPVAAKLAGCHKFILEGWFNAANILLTCPLVNIL